MKVKLVHLEHAAGLIDPVTKRSPFIVADAEGKPRAVDTAEVPENIHWHRRLLAGEITRVETTTPVGNEPTAPLTTR